MNDLPRRDFLKLSGLTMSSGMLNILPSFAGPFAKPDFDYGIPRDKKLRPEWIKSLYDRGTPTEYRKSRDELKYIGMPIGGICCGTVYLGGDGQLWLWDIFNDNRNGVVPGTIEWKGGTWQHRTTISAQDGAAYVMPHHPQSPFRFEFSLTVRDGKPRPLQLNHWEEIKFVGQYPVGRVEYSDSNCPATVESVVYSPFIPLDADDSGIPAIVFEITVTNHGESGQFALSHTLENFFDKHPDRWPGFRSVRRIDPVTRAEIIDLVPDKRDGSHRRNDVVVDDFDRESYAPWEVFGEAFGLGPILRKDVPDYQGALGGSSHRVVNSHASAPASEVGSRDAKVGRLRSQPFIISRRFVSIEIGGGKNVAEVGIRLLIGATEVFRAAGRDDNHMQTRIFDVSKHEGETATFEIYDQATGPWGHIGVGRIVLTDSNRTTEVEKQPDFGSLAFGAIAPTSDWNKFSEPFTLRPGESQTKIAVIAWHFPNTNLPVDDSRTGNHYASRFHDAASVVSYVRSHFDRLSRQTKLWRDAWYGGSLPHWFLERTFVNTSILATSTAHRFASGRFWAWEGVGCCAGTCTHVWHYAQAVGRIFPSIEQHTREFVDFGVGFDAKTGVVGHRGERTGPAVDGECGRILGVLREHQMSTNDAFLRRVWPRVKLAIEFLLRHDTDHDGLIDGAQENTLDAAWFGKIAWISSLFLAALKAGESMAATIGDSEFASVCANAAEKTRHAIETQLFDGEYFIQLPEPGREGSLGTYKSCHIDQVHGQSWAWQVGLDRILDRKKTLSALKSLYKYNFTPDVGPFRKANPEGRPYALAGDGGLVMATNPHGLAQPFGNAKDWQFGYFNECMSGFEHQAASHMIAEGLVQDGLAVTRAIHDRYHARLRNPYNEIECSDHYSRAMASYGSFVSICGFACDGPTGMIQFDPRIQADHFRAAFTSAEGWGTYLQRRTDRGLAVTLELLHGKLNLKQLRVRTSGKTASVEAKLSHQNGLAVLDFDQSHQLVAGQTFEVTIS